MIISNDDDDYGDFPISNKKFVVMRLTTQEQYSNVLC